MKKLFVIALLLTLCQYTMAQHAGRFRMGMDLGAAIPKGGGIGALVNLEPKVNLKDNMNVGIRFGIAGLAKDVTYYDFTEDYEGEISANISISGTFDYYFNQGGTQLAPYIGAGFGYYTLSSVQIDNGDFDVPDNFGDLEADFKWAPMVRAGVELGKFRMGAEYNFVPKSNLQNASGEVIGEAINQYFGFTLGFYVGGGRWRGM
ncbi:outer membrane beta-barrel protein [Algoriphagus halophilus]|uniref:Outer membrane protein beta-barrel domain-containing protein n=1 Tax=Algoriphagus halophilus TaxID=226505 RepID=A0A1N6HA46_9BACT|nr:outer membrane beta-barrel protein [Algoriphagus halophilus]SIO16620.1 Outer membrane protein beta-barrel domain-containing protein [Algoriphagus halophilus]